MRTVLALAALIAVLAVTAPALAADGETPDKANDGPTLHQAVAGVGIGLCAALVVFAGAMGISRIGSHGLDAIARQPEAAGSMFLAWLFPAAFIEGAMLFGLVICMLALDKIFPG